MDNAELIRNVAIAGHLHHGKVSQSYTNLNEPVYAYLSAVSCVFISSSPSLPTIVLFR